MQGGAMKPGPLKALVPLSISGVVPGQITVLHLNDHAAVLQGNVKLHYGGFSELIGDAS